jgi:predicted transposase YbfD/YdcC
MALDQLVCDGKTLKGSAIETAEGNHRFVAQVTVYVRALGVALVQKNYHTHQSSERSALKELLSTMNLEGQVIQADALHTTQAFFAGALTRRPTSPSPSKPASPRSVARAPASSRESARSLSPQRLTRNVTGVTRAGNCGPRKRRITARRAGRAAPGSWS